MHIHTFRHTDKNASTCTDINKLMFAHANKYAVTTSHVYTHLYIHKNTIIAGWSARAQSAAVMRQQLTRACFSNNLELEQF